MYPEIEAVLENYGYQKIQMNIVGLSLSVKQTGEEGFVIVTVDETTGVEISRDQFVHISEQIREFLKKRESYYNAFLYLLISENDQSEKRLFETAVQYWRIIPSARQIITCDVGEEALRELQHPLEILFPSKGVSGFDREKSDFRHRDSYGNAGRMRGRLKYGGRFPLGNGKIPYLNLAIIFVNLFLFFLTDLFFFQNDSIVEWGALNWQLVLEQGEWYRIFTSMFLHDGIRHIFNNMLVLLYIGSCVEQQMGSLRYGILYLGSGVLAGFTSMVYNMNLNENVYSLGASGAIFGIMGSLLFLVLFQKRYASGFNLRQIAVMVFFSLYGGLTSQGVDNAAHIGGFISGFFLIMLLSIFKKHHSNEFGGNI